jgi:hypothetical protein
LFFRAKFHQLEAFCRREGVAPSLSLSPSATNRPSTDQKKILSEKNTLRPPPPLLYL